VDEASQRQGRPPRHGSRTPPPGPRLRDIVARLHVSKSSVSLWVRDLPRPVSEEDARRHRTEAAREYWLAQQPVRDARRVAERDAAAREIGRLTDREIIIAGAIAYWCEGTKSKRTAGASVSRS
jgi:hypothetical protein